MTRHKSSLFTVVVLAVTLFVVVLGCSNLPSIKRMDAESAYRHLIKEYDKGHYLDVVDGLNYYTLNYSGSAWVDSAQFLLGESHFKLKEYLLAANAYDELSRRFPSSPLVPRAMLKIGECYWKMSPKYSLDQEYTYKAISSLQSYIDYYPKKAKGVERAEQLIRECRDKIAHKTYANGIIYLKMKD